MAAELGIRLMLPWYLTVGPRIGGWFSRNEAAPMGATPDQAPTPQDLRRSDVASPAVSQGSEAVTAEATQRLQRGASNIRGEDAESESSSSASSEDTDSSAAGGCASLRDFLPPAAAPRALAQLPLIGSRRASVPAASTSAGASVLAAVPASIGGRRASVPAASMSAGASVPAAAPAFVTPCRRASLSAIPEVDARNLHL